uniref:DUF1353 domain-containing protein n=1 Tax=viral metagenome TaxID=1070528 RepID=A0A6H1ZPY4_9ZZZZ
MKSEFQTSLSARLKDETDCVWIIDKPLKYWSELLNRLIVVPPWFETKEPDEAGETEFFETDFASVPRVPLFYAMWGDRAHREAVLHDYLYRIDSNPVVSYSIANSIFLEAMKATGKSWRVRYPMYWGVVLGGWTAYHKKRVKDKI